MPPPFEGSAANELPEEQKGKPRLRTAKSGDAPRDVIELQEEDLAAFEQDTARMGDIKAERRRNELEAALEEGVKEFDEQSAQMALERDNTLNRHLAIAAEAKREAERVRETFAGMEKPYTDAWELMLKLRKYDVELEDALYEAMERPELERELKAAREERNEIVTARKRIEHVLKKIQKAVEHTAADEEAEPAAAESETAAVQEFLNDIGDQAEVRRDLKKGLIDAEARGALEVELQERAEQIEARIRELNALLKDEAANPQANAAYETAMKALTDVRDTLHALFEEDRTVIREAAEDLQSASKEDIDAAVERMDLQAASSKEIADALENIQAGELQQIPGNIEATREKSGEVNSLAEHIRGEIDRYEEEGVIKPRPFGAELARLDRLSSELDERLDLLYGKDDHTKDEKKEFEIIADAKHLIQDLKHEIKSYEQHVPRKDVVAGRELERNAAAQEVKKRQLENLAEDITRTLKATGVENPDAYLAFQSAGAAGKLKRWLGALIGKKAPELDEKKMEEILDKLTRIQTDFEVEYYTAAERKNPTWQKNIRDRARLNHIPVQASLFEVWKTIHEEIEDISNSLPPSLAIGSSLGEGSAKQGAREHADIAETRRGQKRAATERNASFGLTQARNEEEFFKEPEEVMNERIAAAKKAGVKDAEEIWYKIMTDPSAPDMKYLASEIVDQLAELASAIKKDDKSAMHEAALRLADMQEDLTERMGGIQAIDDLILKANRKMAKKETKRKVRKLKAKKKPSKRKTKKAA